MSSTNKFPVTHVIFDLDGLLLDTETLYTEAIQNVTSQFGVDYPWSLKVKCMGMQGHLAAQLIIDELSLPLTVPQYMEKVNHQYELVFPKARLLPGAEKLVGHLHSKNIPIAIASGGNLDNFKLKTSQLQKFVSLFHHIVLASSDPEVKEGKPKPDVFRICAERFPDKPQPQRCLVFEDAPNGVAAAVAAQMQVVMVPDSRLDRSFTEDATLVLDSLEEFQPELFGLPRFDC